MKKLKLEKKSINYKVDEVDSSVENGYENNKSIENNIKILFGNNEILSEADKLTILKILIFFICIGISIFSLYHIFFGENGINAQKEKSEELIEIKNIKKLKEGELEKLNYELNGLKNRDIKIIENEARKKGYIYENEVIFRIIDRTIVSDEDNLIKLENDYKLNIESPSNKYLTITIIFIISIILLSSFFNLISVKTFTLKNKN